MRGCCGAWLHGGDSTPTPTSGKSSPPVHATRVWLVTQLASSVSSLGKRDPRSRRGGRTGATPARAAEGGQADPPFASPTRDKMGSLDATRDELATRPARRETASRLARRDFAQGRPRGAPPFGMDPDPANFDFGKFARIRELFRWD